MSRVLVPRFLGLGALLLVSALEAACASSGAVPKPFPMPGGEAGRTAGPAASESTTVDTAFTGQIIRTALDLRGTPYRNGGSEPSGFDCSGFTQWVFAQAGLRLPRETRDQFRAGVAVRRGSQRAGDLIFFSTTAPGPSHVGIALGPDTFVHAPSSRGVVRVESLTQSYWSRRLVGVRRLAVE